MNSINSISYSETKIEETKKNVFENRIPKNFLQIHGLIFIQILLLIVQPHFELVVSESKDSLLG